MISIAVLGVMLVYLFVYCCAFFSVLHVPSIQSILSAFPRVISEKLSSRRSSYSESKFADVFRW